MRGFITISLLAFWLVQVVPQTLLAKTSLDQSATEGIFEEDDLFLDSRYLPLEEDLD
jgi:hypothetical protein